MRKGPVVLTLVPLEALDTRAMPNTSGYNLSIFVIGTTDPQTASDIAEAALGIAETGDSMKEAVYTVNVWNFYDGFRLIPIRANAQPAFALYTFAKEGGTWNAHSLQVLSMREGRIAALTTFMKPISNALFAEFGLPQALETFSSER